MRILRRGWRAVYAILCVCVHSTVARSDVYGGPGVRVPDGVDTRQSFREMSSHELSHGGNFHRKLIPIKSPRPQKQFVTQPLEPDAEMLPAHYKGVKPPGVDHMELRYAESQISKVVPVIQSSGKSDRNEGGHRVSARQGKRQETEKGREGREKVVSFEKGRKGGEKKQKKKVEYSEAGGRRRTNTERDNDSKHEVKEAGGAAGAEHRRSSNGGVGRKAAGFHNVYHKDEYKKDHDFYDNDDQGGHLKKHGRYNEKHVAIEGTLKQGGDRGAGFNEEELRKKGTTKNSQAERESKGHDARRGYDGFFENFQGFAKQAGGNEGKKFGFAAAKAR